MGASPQPARHAEQRGLDVTDELSNVTMISQLQGLCQSWPQPQASGLQETQPLGGRGAQSAGRLTREQLKRGRFLFLKVGYQGKDPTKDKPRMPWINQTLSQTANSFFALWVRSTLYLLAPSPGFWQSFLLNGQR